MKIWHISDTHGHHRYLNVPKDIDMVIHSGDASNYRDPYRNEPEMRDFLGWFYELPIEHKVFVAGNHDTSVEKGLVSREDFENLGMHYIYMETREVAGLKIWGSPYCPTYGNWSFMKSRETIGRKVWDYMDMQADIVITHTPPRGMLDYSDHYIYDPALNKRRVVLETCGCNYLRKKVLECNPKLHCFGHIHSTKEIDNFGTRTMFGVQTIFSNGACCVDGERGRMRYHGNIIEIKEDK